MADNKPELKDFDGDDDAPQQTSVAQPMGVGLGTHAAVGLGGFKDFCIKAELMRAIAENGFEHPSEVQHRAIPEAMLGTDILAQAKAGMGKTAVFVFALLEQIAPPAEKEKPSVQAVVVVHARQHAFRGSDTGADGGANGCFLFEGGSGGGFYAAAAAAAHRAVRRHVPPPAAVPAVPQPGRARCRRRGRSWPRDHGRRRRGCGNAENVRKAGEEGAFQVRER